MKTSKNLKWVGLGAVAVLAVGLVAQFRHSHAWRRLASISEPEVGLTQSEAELRFQQVSDVSYRLSVQLSGDLPDFTGTTQIQFQFHEEARSLSGFVRVDFQGGTVDELLVNGRPVTHTAGQGWIGIPVAALQAGSNQLSIRYHHPYGNDGNGLHRFTDPEDQEKYLYTNFEPYYANRLFPCFDQPDLKATYELEVDAPEAWEVISSRLGTATAAASGMKHWVFPVSERFSTYLISLHAGPYRKWESRAGSIPLRLFARRSLAQYVDVGDWFEVTRKGLSYYPEYFGTPYPYGKYDQVIVPDFNPGAMENVAAVTFSEGFVNRARITELQRMGRAETILHEMAHMWFGDLVTMKWWNGLWLNESFATFTSAQAVDAAGFQGVWQGFFSGTKAWAYSTDHQVTTHPIEAVVENTSVAFANFDGITYGKGASSLKQLAYFQGSAFQTGLKNYFRRFAGKNTTLSDFIQTQAEASGKNLAQWQQEWLNTTGMNTVQAEWRCEGSDEQARIASFELVQSAFRDNTVLRSHRTQIALLSFDGQQARVQSTLDTEYSGARTAVPGLVGRPCPKAVYPNFGDYDYVRVALDDVSVRFAREKISKIQDPFLREMFWSTLWEMTMDGRLPARDYIRSVLVHAEHESNSMILNSLLRNVARRSLVAITAVTLLQSAEQEAVLGEIEAAIRARMLAAAPGSDVQQEWFEGYLRVFKSDTSTTWAKGLLAGTENLRGFTLGQDHRWKLVKALARSNVPDAETWITQELQRDASDQGKKEGAAARAIIPNLETQRVWLARLLRQRDQEQYRPSELKTVARSFLNVQNEPFAREVTAAWLQNVIRLAGSEDEEYLGALADAFTPMICDEAEIQRLGSFIQEQGDQLPEVVLRMFRVWKQDLETCQRARRL